MTHTRDSENIYIDMKVWTQLSKFDFVTNFLSHIGCPRYKKIFQSSIRLIIRLLLILLLIYSIYSICLYADYNFNAKHEIEESLNEKSKSILIESANDTQKTQKIIEWERNELSTKPFNLLYVLIREISKDAKWFIYLKRASCGELAIIFEDMADRTNLTYRKVVVGAIINPSSKDINNHRWSEVWLDEDWRIADSGFNFYYPNNNNFVFTDDRKYLLGHVTRIDENMTDRTEAYVNNTGKLVIKAIRDDKAVKNATVNVILNYNDLSCKVVGGTIIKRFTNDTGVCEINLGIYDDVCYTVIINDLKSVYKYSGQEENITINNKTTPLEIELNELKPRYGIIAICAIIILIDAKIFYSIVIILKKKRNPK